MKHKSTLLALTIASLGMTTTIAQAQTSIEVGILTCELSHRTNVVLLSGAAYQCELDATVDGVNSGIYTGEIKRVGIDLNLKTAESLAWTVIAVTNGGQAGSIEGNYFGGGADAALGFGVGGRLLVGGFGNSFALQPLSVSGQRGVGAALGVDRFELTYDGEVAN